MPRARKKPVEVDFVQLTWENWQEVCEFCDVHSEGIHGCYLNEEGVPVNGSGEMGLIIPTLEGRHVARRNDYIIKGVNGEFYPCKPDIFEKTYDII